jgi:hypothetical protein
MLGMDVYNAQGQREQGVFLALAITVLGNETARVQIFLTVKPSALALKVFQ